MWISLLLSMLQIQVFYTLIGACVSRSNSYFSAENDYCGTVETSLAVTVQNGTENSITCFEVPNFNDTSFMLFLSSGHSFVTLGNEAAAITIEGKINDLVMCN